MKILVTGPPNSGKRTIAAGLSDYDVVVATRLDVEQSIVDHDKFDVAIVVVDAGHLCEGIFSYMTLVQTLGVPAVAVLNKMDKIDYCQTQYIAMAVVLGDCVPMAHGQVIDNEWYNGTTLMSFIERK